MAPWPALWSFEQVLGCCALCARLGPSNPLPGAAECLADRDEKTQDPGKPRPETMAERPPNSPQPRKKVDRLRDNSAAVLRD